jgi:Protein of unknown function (DUF2934)
MKKSDIPLHEPTEADIQKKAYHLWVEGGCLEGIELDNWLAAKELLRHHHGRTVDRTPLRPANADGTPAAPKGPKSRRT